MLSRYFAASAFFSSLRLSQLYLRWNFSTRPVVSTNFILPVKNGWHTEQISTEMFFLVLRVTNLLPQPQVTVQSSYLGWMSFFMASLDRTQLSRDTELSRETRQRTREARSRLAATRSLRSGARSPHCPMRSG